VVFFLNLTEGLDFFVCLVSDAVSNRDFSIVNGIVGRLVKNELGRMLKETPAVSLKVLFRYFPGGTEKNHEKLQSG
jgi:hypothetical protein